jgi:hypothetical protein
MNMIIIKNGYVEPTLSDVLELDADVLAHHLPARQHGDVL